ncbi:hypothetical protein DFH08DRAFT_6581 [Mycena albidolilacea]|uniref:Uncharacterized protein n=1 Tax=Mycena albidolilacea TaxID=1033008 RepID=A0AAD7F684_9AGAR|nr:hypothetical protein DFH08DRAFT_6581 [Mycena albidolilacea]
MAPRLRSSSPMPTPLLPPAMTPLPSLYANNHTEGTNRRHFVLHPQRQHAVGHRCRSPVNKARTLHLLDPATNILRVPLSSELVLPTIYRYQPLPGTTLLTKHSERQNKSVTETTGVASTMRRQVLKRDNDTCWITEYNDSSVVINSHILSKRMDDAMARRLLHDFRLASSPFMTLFLASPYSPGWTRDSIRIIWVSARLPERWVRSHIILLFFLNS